MKIETTYKIVNSPNGSVLTVYWADIPVRKVHYSCKYYGGDIHQFENNNKDKRIFSATIWAGINKFNELYGYNPDTKI